MKKNARTSKKRLPAAARIGLMLVAVLILFNGYTLAKYLFQKQEKPLFQAKNFYFESDLLAPSTKTMPQYTLQAGVNKIEFLLKNHPDALRVSEVDIAYTAVLEQDGADPETTNGTIEISEKNETVSFENLQPGTYTVTASATAPYTATLQARFTVVGTDSNIVSSVFDGAGSPNLKVTVTTADYAGNIVITWPAGVLPDNTDPLLQGVTEQSCTVAVNAQSEYTFQFFKTNPNAVYDNTQVTVGTSS